MKTKKIKVKSAGWEMDVEVDPSTFEDFIVEACTRAVERNIRANNMVLSPFMEATVSKTPKIYVLNTYKILVNAGYHIYAANLRRNVKIQMKVDLLGEPIMA